MAQSLFLYIPGTFVAQQHFNLLHCVMQQQLDIKTLAVLNAHHGGFSKETQGDIIAGREEKKKKEQSKTKE